MWRHDWGTCARVLLSKASQGSMHCAQECTHWQTDSVKFNINYTPRAHVGICMQVWLVDVGHMVVVLEHTPSLPCPHAYFFHQFIPTLIFLNVLVCLLFWWPLAILNYLICHHQHQHSFLHLHSFVYLVFHFRHTTKNQKGKPPA